MQYLCKLSALLCVCDYNVYLYRTAEPFCPVSLKDECNSVMSWGIWRGREAEITNTASKRNDKARDISSHLW